VQRGTVHGRADHDVAGAPTHGSGHRLLDDERGQTLGRNLPAKA
jgi:hypothetical protein